MLFSRSSNLRAAETAVAGEGVPLRAFKLPSKEEKMEHHIARAGAATDGVFEYVAITSARETSLRKLREKIFASRKRPLISKRMIEQTPPLLLTALTTEFELEKLVDVKRCGPFVSLAEIVIHYTPLVSEFGYHSTLRVGLIDKRLTEENEIRSVTSLHTLGFNAQMAMDFFVPRTNLSCFSLVVTLSSSSTIEGIAWGALRVGVKILESDAPSSIPLVETVAVLAVSEGLLHRKKVNPKHVDLSIDDEDLAELAKLQKAGRLVDPSSPVDKRVRGQYAASEVGSDNSGSPAKRVTAADWAVEQERLRSLQVRRVGTPPPSDRRYSYDSSPSSPRDRRDPAESLEEVGHEKKAKFV